MLVSLIISILSSLLWINVLFAELVTAKVNPYVTDDNNTDKMLSKVKIILVTIMSLSWGCTIYFW